MSVFIKIFNESRSIWEEEEGEMGRAGDGDAVPRLKYVNRRRGVSWLIDREREAGKRFFVPYSLVLTWVI
jgi:hypothetical protein